MIRIAWLCIFAAVVCAQSTPEPGSLAALEADARQKTATWQKLALEMESTVARLLPCDAKAPVTITLASQASETRLAAISAYLQADQQEAARESAGAQRVLVAAQTLISELSIERSDVAQEQSGVDGQLANLTESVKKRPALADTQKMLQQLQSLTAQRATLAQGGLDRQEAFLAAVRGLVTMLQAREASLKDAGVAYEAERARWNAYYAARLARAQTECSITRATPALPPARAPQGKQK
ncbi:MAG TPA: hypothetical protein VGN17_06625 [Bryobacteraceae bacterium]|jgi:hypothetical protein